MPKITFTVQHDERRNDYFATMKRGAFEVLAHGAGQTRDQAIEAARKLAQERAGNVAQAIV